MTSKKSYNRYFIIFQEDDRGFGVAIDKQPTGYTKIETRNDKCKITVYAQNLRKDRGPYLCCLVDATKNPVVMAKLGEIKIDEMGRGETWWEFKEDDIAGTGMSVDRFNVAAIIVDSNPLICPVVGYIGKDKVLWKDRVETKARSVQQEDETYVTEEELDDEALKFKSYEEEIKKGNEPEEKVEEVTRVTEEAPDPETEDTPDLREENRGVPGLLNQDDEEPVQEVKSVPGGIAESINSDMFRDGDDSDDRKKYANMFNNVLGSFKGFNNVPEELQGTKWWLIPHDDEIPVRENKYYPYYCAVYHLKMTYPYINYIKYFKKHGGYYFGIRYDKSNEVKYIMYGIEGKNIISDQPYMGMTGFVKWVPFKDSDRGMWVMYYNPYTGSIMIPKQRKEQTE